MKIIEYNPYQTEEMLAIKLDSELWKDKKVRRKIIDKATDEIKIHLTKLFLEDKKPLGRGRKVKLLLIPRNK